MMKLYQFLSLVILLAGNAASAASQRRRYLREELSYDARKALSQAVLSAIKSPTGEIEPSYMDEAVAKGISRESVLRAAELALEKTGNSQMTDPRSVELKNPSYRPAEEQGLAQGQSFPDQVQQYHTEDSAIQVSTGIPEEATGPAQEGTEVQSVEATSSSYQAAGMSSPEQTVVNTGSGNDIQRPSYATSSSYQAAGMSSPEQTVVNTGSGNDIQLPSYSSSAIQQAAGMTTSGATSATVEVPQTTVQATNSEPSASGQKKRKFVEYQSSEWEMIWLSKVYDWSNKHQICEVLFEDQKEYIHLYLKMLCTSRLSAPHSQWCVIDDGEFQLWYNTENVRTFDLSWERPREIPMDFSIPPPQAVVPSAEYERVASKFTYLDETTGVTYSEYIEPLVSHLRFPLSKCIPKPTNPEHVNYDANFKGFIVPPPPVVRGDHAVLYDTGSKSWKDGMSYIFNIWKRHGVSFDAVRSYDADTDPNDFWTTVPQEYIPLIQKMKIVLASQPEEALATFPFLPKNIEDETSENDYVVLKLDIDRALVESRNIDYIIQHAEETHIDEILWEHHVTGNYLMYADWPKDATAELNLRQSYEYFLRLRKKGIRAHSWV